MNKKEIVVSLVSVIVIILSYVFMNNFEFLLMAGVITSSLVYWLLNNRIHLNVIKRIFVIYKFILTSVYSIILIVFSYILYNGNKYKQNELMNDIDCVLVLGSRLEDERIPEVLRMRLDKALECYNANSDALFIVSGGPVDEFSLSEAEAMYDYLISHGVKESNVFIEDQAQCTYENIKFAKSMLLKMGFSEDKVMIVSSDFHLARSLMIASLFDIESCGLASETPKDLKLNYLIREIFAFIKDFIKCSADKVLI